MISQPKIELVRLKHVASVEMGQSPPSSEYSDLPENGLPFLQGTADFGVKQPNPSVYCPVPNKVAIKDDILLSVRAPVGTLNIADQKYGIGRGLCAIKCVSEMDKQFVWWALHWARDQLAYEATGSTYEAVAVEDVANLLLPRFSFEEQKAIGTYLDREIGKIDVLMKAKERLLALLEEKRRALITHAVTRGLNPAAPTRDSGIEWLGHIPAHWQVEYARWLFDEIDERSTTGEEELLTVSHITGVTSRAEKEVNMFMAESLEGYKVCHSGDLVINTLWAWMGAMGTAFRPGIVSPAYNVYRPRGQYEPRYIDYLVRITIFAQEVIRFSRGVWSSRLRLYPAEFFQIVLPVPPLAEQTAIVDYLDHQIAKLDALESATKKTIDLLQERRTALIAAAVTGQIPVPESSWN